MDTRSIETMMEAREKGYIWLERELRVNMMISTAWIAVFFLALFLLNPSLKCGIPLFITAIVTELLWNYRRYRREYANYLYIMNYLEAFEEGDYGYRNDTDYMKTGIHSQITEQLDRLGMAFHTLTERLRTEKENTKQLVTDISYQLKTPIAATQLSYEILEDGDISEEERQEFLQRGKKEVQKLSNLLDALMNLSRLEAGMIEIHQKDASLKETLIQAVNGIYLKAQDRQMDLEMQEFQDMVLSLDERWTAEAFSNVLDNAVKYSPAKSTIRIRVLPQISYVLIEVEDEGIGIPQKEYAKIFGRFYRGNEPEVVKSEGSGVGLYLVRYILEAQGGSVRALPATGRGTIIQMMLPKKSYMCERK